MKASQPFTKIANRSLICLAIVIPTCYWLAKAHHVTIATPLGKVLGVILIVNVVVAILGMAGAMLGEFLDPIFDLIEIAWKTRKKPQ